MSPSLKKVVAIHDLSCYGRGPLSIIIPVLSVLKSQVCPLPSALMSTHTAGFKNYTALDLSAEMTKIAAHFASLSLSFDAIYTGFFGSLDAMKSAKNFIESFKKGALVCVDPVMGDSGTLYSGYDGEMVKFMGEIASEADILIPNYTEATILLDIPYEGDKPMSPREAGALLKKLRAFSKKSCVITGIDMGEHIGVAAYDHDKNESFLIKNEKINAFFPGTGDMYTSVMLGNLLLGKSLLDSLLLASSFNLKVIKETVALKTPARESLVFEPFLSDLLKGYKEDLNVTYL